MEQIQLNDNERETLVELQAEMQNEVDREISALQKASQQRLTERVDAVLKLIMKQRKIQGRVSINFDTWTLTKE